MGGDFLKVPPVTLTPERPSYNSCIVHLLHPAHQIQAHTNTKEAKIAEMYVYVYATLPHLEMLLRYSQFGLRWRAYHIVR